MPSADRYRRNSQPNGPDDADAPDTRPAAQQRVVLTSAATAPRGKPRGAVASVFDAARAARPARKAQVGGVRPSLPPLDPAALVFTIGEPKPARHSKPGTSKYAAVFAGLTQPGASTKLPIAYLGTIKSMAKKRAQAGLGKYSVLRVNDTTCGIWRDE